jgi:hypothetical protein
VSVIQNKNNKTVLLQNQDKTSKNEDKEEVTHNNDVDEEEDLHEKFDFYNEEYRNGYETYMQSMNKFREEQENTYFPAVSKREENNQPILDVIHDSSIQYLKNFT